MPCLTLNSSVWFLQIENQNGRRGGGDEVPPSENQRPDDDPGLLELPHNPHHHCCPHFLLRWGTKHKKLQTEGKGDDANVKLSKTSFSKVSIRKVMNAAIEMAILGGKEVIKVR